MPQLLESTITQSSNKILCCYINQTHKFQITRIINIPNWYFERTILPGERLLFETFSGAQLEIHTYAVASAILSDRILCDRLAAREDI